MISLRGLLCSIFPPLVSVSTMKLFLGVLALHSASGLVLSPLAPNVMSRTADIRMEGVINDSIDKDNEKVVHFCKVPEMKGKKGVYCRCWKSKVFPLCDQTHVKHNEVCTAISPFGSSRSCAAQPCAHVAMLRVYRRLATMSDHSSSSRRNRMEASINPAGVIGMDLEEHNFC